MAAHYGIKLIIRFLMKDPHLPIPVRRPMVSRDHLCMHSFNKSILRDDYAPDVGTPWESKPGLA